MDAQCAFVEAAVGLPVPSLSVSRLVGRGYFPVTKAGSGPQLGGSPPAEDSLEHHLGEWQTPGGTSLLGAPRTG